MVYYRSEQLIIRPMKKDDIDRLFCEYGEQGWPCDMSILNEYFEQQERAERYILIAEHNGQTAGYVTLWPNAKFGPFAEKNIPELVDFIVFKKYQRQGIGSKILDAAEDIASKLSDTVSLSVGVHSGYGSAQRMYIKRGYIPDGSGVWFNNKPLEEYADCKNDDTLVLYLSKALR